MRTWIRSSSIYTRIYCAISILWGPATFVKTDNGYYIIKAPRKLTLDEQFNIADYLNGKRFMSRYHAGKKKEKPPKEPKVKKERKLEGRYMI